MLAYQICSSKYNTMPIWATVVMNTYHHQERSSTPSTRSSPSWASVHGAFVHKEAQRKVHKLSEIINRLNWEKVARLQVELHIDKQHGQESWSMKQQSFSCLLSKYEVQNTIQCRYERQLSWILTIIRSDASSTPASTPSSPSWASVHGAIVHKEASTTHGVQIVRIYQWTNMWESG